MDTLLTEIMVSNETAGNCPRRLGRSYSLYNITAEDAISQTKHDGNRGTCRHLSLTVIMSAISHTYSQRSLDMAAVSDPQLTVPKAVGFIVADLVGCRCRDSERPYRLKCLGY